MAENDPVAIEGGWEPGEILFVGMGSSAVAWYRCYLPAMFMGADWVGLVGDPPEAPRRFGFATGLVKRETQMPALEDYKVIVIQQPRGAGWLKIIRGLQEVGIKVLFEIDDYVHAIRKMPDHDFAEHFQPDGLRALELNMRVCDGLICSTEYVAQRYRTFNRNVWVCRNGVDVGRYQLTRPKRPTVNVGWAGGTGHKLASLPWLAQIGVVMHGRENTCFVSIGQNFADAFTEQYGNRAISIPFTLLDVYPSAMTMFDIAVAPAGKGNFFRGKSDLRWVEAGALGIPIIADPGTYPDIEHGVTGFHAATPEEARETLFELVDNEELRTRVGEAAREHVREQRDMRVMVRAWGAAINEVLAA